MSGARDYFDVILTCACGHRAVLQLPEHPQSSFSRKTFRCSACGRIAGDGAIEVRPIWVRAFKGDPRD
ncbi:hypothetical protein [Paracoccus litorisediminis]|uniref:Uncharacterized protein n=1 Tax=Paracoccus litorisediminis TaxID=2006130 RepID=A0A844HQ29_9RHOB|nr:hypothetical protein [Paracoccus litorisediminis]MTH61168.1 hypothetical protein [Paracoccus litorisediminis]